MKDIDSHVLAPRGSYASFLDEDGDACWDQNLVDSEYLMFDKILKDILGDNLSISNPVARVLFLLKISRFFSIESTCFFAKYSYYFYADRKPSTNFLESMENVRKAHKEYVESLRAELARHDAYLAQFNDE